MNRFLPAFLFATVFFPLFSQEAPETENEHDVDPRKLLIDDFNTRHSFQITGRLQMRTYLSFLEATPRIYEQSDLLETVNSDSAHWGSEARRLRMGMKGNLDKVHWQLDLRSENMVSVHENASMITFAYVGYKFHKDFLDIRIGSDELPFSREWVTSSASLVTMERAQIIDSIADFYGNGLFVESHPFDRKLTLYASVTGGEGGFFAGTNTTNTEHPLFGMRLQYDPIGEYINGVSYMGHSNLISFGIGSLFATRADPDGKPYKEDYKNLAIGTFDTTILLNSFELSGAVAYSAAEKYHYWGYHITPAQFVYKRFVQIYGRYEMMSNGSYIHTTSLPSGTPLPAEKDVSQTKTTSFGINLYSMYQNHIKLQIAHVFGLNQSYHADTGKWKDLGISDDWTAVQAQVSF